jgi:hypothetical protein
LPEAERFEEAEITDAQLEVRCGGADDFSDELAVRLADSPALPVRPELPWEIPAFCMNGWRD